MKHIKKAVVCSVAVIVGIVLNQYSDQIRSGEQGLNLIGNAEGCMRNPYQCPADVLTVGIGSTEAGGAKIDRSRTYTDQEIAARWVKDIIAAERCVNRYGNGENMPQGAFEAMTSLTFNVGCGKMRKSTLFRMANQGYRAAMCDQFSRWVYFNGKPSKGLQVRRAKERALCLA
ncbi:lysozyme [Pasteurella testudinis DSM 23072]|uniref:Lysozyme n=1 Tax=Pasteurella testudinis DSM 23072 TaxID=1122938 RepID=A0A1W1UMX7_9PAST|nr:lysozyme [Pasteurella testudinis]SMB82437.1 lysozyme [Pasteurella testudinis DSM 23072]SUB52207.1 lysozyme [Pasteurella testudinis]